jgi:N-acyl-D-amino-acid deacylase
LVRRYIAGLNGNPDISWDWSSVSEYLSLFNRRVGINVAYLVPHNALRLETVGFVDRLPTAKEMSKMQQLLESGIREGAVGFSTGLDYYPARYSNTDELIGLCEVVAEHKAVSVWHLRTRDIGLLEAAKEAIAVAARTGVKVHISHYAASNPPMWGRSGEMLALVNEARDSTVLIIFLPRWVHEGGPDAILERLKQPKTKEKICADLRAASYDWNRFVLSSVVTKENKIYIGKSINEAADMAGKKAEEFICDLLIEEELAISYTSSTGNEADIQTIMKHPCHTACSDGLLIGDKPNPRGWGTFARYLGYYGRELAILRLEEVIRHMTAAPAQRFGLNDRGLIKEGLAADLVVFNPQKVIDRATFDEPTKYPDGIDYVLVNGAVAVDKGKHTGVLNGRALYRTTYQ